MKRRVRLDLSSSPLDEYYLEIDDDASTGGDIVVTIFDSNGNWIGDAVYDDQTYELEYYEGSTGGIPDNLDRALRNYLRRLFST